MLATNFRVAMHNTIRIAPSYDRPDLTNPPGNEWLIVERSGADGEVLTISDAGTAPGTPPATAPDGLSENNSMFGVLLHENEIGDDAVFVLARHLPPGGTCLVRSFLRTATRVSRRPAPAYIFALQAVTRTTRPGMTFLIPHRGKGSPGILTRGAWFGRTKSIHAASTGGIAGGVSFSRGLGAGAGSSVGL